MWAVVIGEFAAQGNFLKVTENLFRQQQTHKHRSLQRFTKKNVNCAFHTFFFFQQSGLCSHVGNDPSSVLEVT